MKTKIEKERQSKGSVYFFLWELQVSSFFSKRLYKNIFIERSFQPPFIVPNQEILSLVDYKEKNSNLHKNLEIKI